MRVYAEPYFSGMSSVVTSTENIVLNGIRSKFVLINNPTLSLKIKVYDSASNLLVTSDQVKPQSLGATEDFFYADIYFDISPIHLSKNSSYTFELEAVGTQTSSDYVAWVTDWPLPIYDGATATILNANTFPYSIALMGDLL